MAKSSAEEFVAASHFKRILSDRKEIADEKVRRLVLCSGKVAYDLMEAREKERHEDVSIVRLEQLYPFPAEALRAMLDRYPGASDVVWAQEEPRNMGAWGFLSERLARLVPEGGLRYAGRAQGASTATGSHKRHVAEQAALVRDALEGGRPAPALARR
jgi:2-oxoglutarate dehydrogenase E1 component